MKSLRRRVEALEVAAGRGLADKQLDLFLGALEGDPIATTQFEELRGTVRGKLHELLDAIRIPLQNEGEWPYRLSGIDEQRPDD